MISYSQNTPYIADATYETAPEFKMALLANVYCGQSDKRYQKGFMLYFTPAVTTIEPRVPQSKQNI